MAEESRSRTLLRILFDVNVLLDVVLNREPYVRSAARLLAAVETGQLNGLVSAVTAPTIHYIVQRERNRDQSLVAIRLLLEICEVAPVTRAVLVDALAIGFDDYEDAVQHEAARHALADGIVTRNVGDFKPATLAVYTPDQLLQVVGRQ